MQKTLEVCSKSRSLAPCVQVFNDTAAQNAEKPIEVATRFMGVLAWFWFGFRQVIAAYKNGMGSYPH